MAQKQAAAAQPAEPEDFMRQVVMKIIHIMRNIRSVGMDMSMEVELSYPQILVMYVLLETGPATMTQVADWLKISHGVATRTVDRLVEKGIVERERGESDRRVVMVKLSPEGSDYAEKMIGYHLDKMGEVLESVDPQELATFLKLLDKVDRQLDE
ncbi:MAG: MarR family winged helix-turn-helix transcriptional regulator [Candidatus Geothermincolia bacterium]